MQAACRVSEPHLLLQTEIKVLVVGNGNVGKSSMIKRLCKYVSVAGSSIYLRPAHQQLVCRGDFTDEYKKTIGVDFLEKQQYVESLGEDVKLMVWDTAGQEEFDAITRTYYRGTALCAKIVTNGLLPPAHCAHEGVRLCLPADTVASINIAFICRGWRCSTGILNNRSNIISSSDKMERQGSHTFRLLGCLASGSKSGCLTSFCASSLRWMISTLALSNLRLHHLQSRS